VPCNGGVESSKQKGQTHWFATTIIIKKRTTPTFGHPSKGGELDDSIIDIISIVIFG